MMNKRREKIEESAVSVCDCEFFNDSLYEGFIKGAEWADKNPSKEIIIKILKIYDNIFSLSDGGISKNEKDLGYAAEIISIEWNK